MKRFLFLLFLPIMVLMATGQDFQPIRPNNTAFFHLPGGTTLAIRIDSTELVEGDSIFYFYKTWDYDENVMSCYRPTGPSWIGSKAIKKSDSSYLFFNYQGDTLVIIPSASLEDEWEFYRFSYSERLMAKVTELSIEEFLGVVDRVKTISFSLVDEFGNTIPDNPYSDVKIKLSENYGFIQLFPFRDLNSSLDYTMNFLPPPLPIANWYLDGMTQPKLGNAYLTDLDIYNFDVGDEFHTTSLGYELSYYHTESNMITKVVDKVFNEATGIITYHYTKERKYVHTDFLFPENSVDTVYSFNSTSTIDTHNPTVYFPEEVIITDYGVGYFGNWQSYWQFDRRITTPLEVLFFGYIGDDCWALGHIDKDNSTKSSFGYVEGIGSLGHSFHGALSYSGSELVYYKKVNAETWGTPLVISSSPIRNSFLFSVYPNPVKARDNLLISNLPAGYYNLTLLNSFGEVVKKVKGITGDYQLQMPKSLSKGLYILLITDGKGNTATYKLVVE